MIIITGSAGFIGSNMISELNDNRYYDLVLVDDFSREDKIPNYIHTQYSHLVEREDFPQWLRENHRMVQFVIHLGARTDTAEFDEEVFNRLNLNYSKEIWNICVEFGLPLIYASSAATYGDGSLGYSDNDSLIPSLKPLNPYGISKNEFDKWVLDREQKPFFWAGLKFFNVYGPNEFHKGRMASVVYHAYRQIKETGKMKLFRSHHPDYKDGEQLRDFIYVKDVTAVIRFLMEQRPISGIFNLGTGKAETFLELVNQTFRAMGKEPRIEFVDTPADIRDKYQYFTQADMQKLRNAGYHNDFSTLTEGVSDYVGKYLLGRTI
ncbi:MAG: ADP-glyceromanno-heptose 6-epimerase [Bacteroidales bacterium]|nr:ADP-glyceromanno-heptose 6-epimerase [Bacteroidales bacterium]